MNLTPADLELMKRMSKLTSECELDPLRFVRTHFRWGHGDLKEFDGPDDWAVEVLTMIGAALRKNPDDLMPILASIASGHGIGKSAMMAWLSLWAMCTKVGSKGLITANTEEQLRTKTWPEVKKWFGRLLIKDFFVCTDTMITSRDPKYAGVWRFDRVNWSEHNTEAFAGLHNAGNRVTLLFDEASNIADKVWEVADGALTDKRTQIVWCAFGNPTRNSGRFWSSFHGKHKSLWWHRHIDSRTVKVSNKAVLKQMIDANGIDSDYCRVRILGQFPQQSDDQFISSSLVAEARKRAPVELPNDPIILGVDVARFGADRSAIFFRRGNDCRFRQPEIYQGRDTMFLAGRVATLSKELAPDAIFMDGTGVGGGPYDRLVQLGIPQVFEINNASKAHSDDYANMGAQCWGNLREALPRLSLPDLDALQDDLCARGYGYDSTNRLKLESKDDMKKRGLTSPDLADALALCFSWPTGPRDPRRAFAHAQGAPYSGQSRTAHHEFSPY